MASVSVTGGATVDYEYNPSGIRVNADISGVTATDFLIDPYNHTGYAQVFKEKTTAATILASCASSFTLFRLLVQRFVSSSTILSLK